MRRKILIIADWYLPGYKAGGQVTAVANLVELIGDSFEIFIFTRDRDLTDEGPYPNMVRDEWITVGKARVLYTRTLSLRHIRRRVLEIRPDVIYLNSLFSQLTIKILCLRKAGLVPRCGLVLAPRGELSAGASEVKARRKSIFLKCAARAGLYQRLIWQACSESELGQIEWRLEREGLRGLDIQLVSDVFNMNRGQTMARLSRPKKERGARFVFVARISPIKNLLFALDLLAGLSGSVEFDIFGPVDDRNYWRECEKKIASLPGNVKIRYRGTLRQELAAKVAGEYDFFLLPTQGENFGYAILEAMAAGCPVVVSDQTPWQKLSERGAGWSLPLDDRKRWVRVLQECVDMEAESYEALSAGGISFVERWARLSRQLDDAMRLFDRAADRTPFPPTALSVGTPSFREPE